MPRSTKEWPSNVERRKFLKGLAGTTGAAMIAGCSGQRGQDGGDTGGGDTGGGDTGGGDTGGGDTGGDTGGNGGTPQTYVYAEEDTPRSNDPHAYDPSNTTSIYAEPENGYETLLTYPRDNASQLVPLLASKVPGDEEISDDLRTITFPLREGIPFHTGGELTAEDVVYSWNRAITMNVSPDAPTLKSYVNNMEAVDDYTFRVELNSPTAPIFMLTTVTRGIAAVMSKEAIEANGGVQAGQSNEWLQNNSAGTGPYTIGRFDSGNVFVFEYFDDYWNPDAVGLRRIRQVAAPEFATRRAMLERGEAHQVLAAADFYAELEGAQNIETSFFPSFDPAHITFNFEIPYGRDDVEQLTGGDDTVGSDFFQDPDVRLGFAYAFEYDTYIEQVWSGFMSRMTNYHFPGMLGFDESAPIYQTDPAKAEEHFKAAGVWEEGFRVTCHNEILPQFSKGNLLLKDNIEALNPRFEINSVEEPEANAVERHGADPAGWPFEFHGFLPQGPDPDAYYRALMHQDGNVATVTKSYKYMGDEITSRIDAAREAPDQEARISLYQELQRLCAENPAVIPCGVEEGMVTHQPCVDVVDNPGWSSYRWKYFSIDNC